MKFSRRSLVWLNVLGGMAVLGSYVAELARHPDTRGDLWGGVPEAFIPLYTVNMFAAAAGYFAFSSFLYCQLSPGTPRDDGAPGLPLLHLFYGLILIPSALWLPLTFVMLEAPSLALWWVIRIVLFAVGAGTLGLFVTLARSRRRAGPVPRGVAIAGILPFALQTAVLDALIWPAYFAV